MRAAAATKGADLEDLDTLMVVVDGKEWREEWEGREGMDIVIHGC
jgi:hypothetical protein